MSELRLPRSWQDWHITDEIGEGAYGRVYRAEKENGGVKAVSAIKVVQIPAEKTEFLSLRREFSSEEELRRNLKEMVDEYANEIRAMYRLQGQTHIVSIQDHLVEECPDGIGWKIYIRMEYLQSFDDYAVTHTFTEEEIIRLGIALCEALSVCAENGILHRDIKPENLFVTDSGQFKLGDFGIAKAMDRTIPSFSFKGTFSYMAPEVYQGKPYDTRADLYSTGIVLYKLLNRNRDPFIAPDKQIVTHQDREQAMSRRMNAEPLPAPADADRGLAGVILKACEYDPKDRYRSPDQMKQALEALLRPGKETAHSRKKQKILLLCAILFSCAVCAAVLLIRPVKPAAGPQNDMPAETADSYDASDPDENYEKAAAWYLRAAEQGNANAQYRLGLLYWDGKGVEQNYSEAVRWFTEAAKQNHAEALNCLGVFAENGYGMERDDRQAAEWYTQSAEQGNTEAQYRLGLLYLDGRGVEQNDGEAVSWFEKAAEQNHPEAMKYLGICAENGTGTEQDAGRAAEWYTRSAAQENADAQYRLGLLYLDGRGVEQNDGEAVSRFEKAAERNHPEAEYELGMMYEKGRFVRQDFQQAFSWYLRAAEHGLAQAQRRLGDFYRTNSDVQEEGVEKDNIQAAEWYRLAAEQGNVDAQGSLAVCYYYGQGVERDLAEALHWFSEAGKKDPGYQSLVEQLYGMGWVSGAPGPEENIALQYDMGLMYFEGNGLAQDYGKAFQWFTRAAEQNHPEAQDYVGLCCEFGYGTAQDERQAVEWYERSAGQGYANAQYHLALMYHSGKGVEQSYAEAFRWFEKAAEQDHQEAQNYVGLYYENGFAEE